MYDDDRLGAAARHSIELCCGRVHFREMTNVRLLVI